ncbi:MAG: ABC transporter ATP-binding protein [Planctomycetes bacterium]|nr:ABC transporter ATP-binding protein [Planctomycetota bacterium]
MSSDETALLLDDVHSGYGRMSILKGIRLEVKRGEIVALIGANGAGKSTTVNTISGLVRCRQGRILFLGEDITTLPAARRVSRGLVQVPEGRKLFSDLTVLENLEMGSFLRRDRAAVKADLAHVFELFPVLPERRRQLAGSLSGGEQQMCAIARGLMARPNVLLLDEPSLGLAPLLVQQIFGIIRTLNATGTTIFLVEQNANAALRLAHRGYVMETGVLTHAATAPELLADEKVREAYLGK